MKKTKLMLRYETETGLWAIPTTIDGRTTGKATLKYVKWLEELVSDDRIRMTPAQEHAYDVKEKK